MDDIALHTITQSPVISNILQYLSPQCPCSLQIKDHPIRRLRCACFALKQAVDNGFSVPAPIRERLCCRFYRDFRFACSTKVPVEISVNYFQSLPDEEQVGLRAVIRNKYRSAAPDLRRLAELGYSFYIKDIIPPPYQKIGMLNDFLIGRMDIHELARRCRDIPGGSIPDDIFRIRDGSFSIKRFTSRLASLEHFFLFLEWIQTHTKSSDGLVPFSWENLMPARGPGGLTFWSPDESSDILTALADRRIKPAIRNRPGAVQGKEILGQLLELPEPDRKLSIAAFIRWYRTIKKPSPAMLKMIPN